MSVIDKVLGMIRNTHNESQSLMHELQRMSSANPLNLSIWTYHTALVQFKQRSIKLNFFQHICGL